MKKIKMGASSSSSNSITGTYLTDDIWFQIFLHLSLDSIFKFRCVSKSWFLILSNPSFINSWYALNNLSLPWGFVIYAANSVEDQFQGSKFRRMFTFAYPDSLSNFVSHRRRNGFSLSFLNPVFQNNNHCGRPDLDILGSSNGLVLCNAVLSNQRCYYVCNPLTKKWVSLPPPLSPINMGKLATGFVCNESDAVSYKVICIPEFEAAAKDFKVEIFSSDLGEWNIYDISRPQYFTWDFSYFDHFITHNGFFYWMRKGYTNILAFSVNRNTNHGTYGNECRLINLPDRTMDGVREYMNHYLGESEGLICYARINDKEKSLSVWVLKEDWHLVHKDIKIHDMLIEMVSWLIGRATTDDFFELLEEIQVLGICSVDKNVVVLAYRKYIWAYNTRTKGYEQLRYPSFTGSNNFVSHMSALTIAIKLRPTILPPVSRRDISILDAQMSNQE